MFEVENQPPPLEPYNLFTSDACLRAAVKREGAGWAEDGLKALGATLGKPETVKLGFYANKNPTVLKSFDSYGHRLDEVEFHPAWHELMAREGKTLVFVEVKTRRDMEGDPPQAAVINWC